MPLAAGGSGSVGQFGIAIRGVYAPAMYRAVRERKDACIKVVMRPHERPTTLSDNQESHHE